MGSTQELRKQWNSCREWMEAHRNLENKHLSKNWFGKTILSKEAWIVYDWIITHQLKNKELTWISKQRVGKKLEWLRRMEAHIW